MIERRLIATSSNHESVTDSALKDQFDPEGILRDKLEALDEKARNVVSARAGLDGNKKVTLSQIGQEFRLSRERIRQIERDAMIKLSDKLEKNDEQSITMVLQALDHQGGVASEEHLLHLVLPKSRRASVDVNALRLFLRLMKDVAEVKESKTMRSGWVLKRLKAQLVNRAIEKSLTLVRENGAVIDFDSLWERLTEFHDMPKRFVLNALSLSKEIITTTDSQYGLSSWSSINPKNVRDKIYYVLFHHGKPLHFTDITKQIREKGFDSKKVVQPTVHNELIADDRFVLVGRGIYALSEWGYKPGTVEDIIQEVLRKAKHPLTTDEIVMEVLRNRHVKKNTIIINLQIKPQFVKVGKKLYTLAEKAQATVSSDVKATIAVAESKKH